jgi:hypothetical protein
MIACKIQHKEEGRGAAVHIENYGASREARFNRPVIRRRARVRQLSACSLHECRARTTTSVPSRLGNAPKYFDDPAHSYLVL